MYLKIVNNILEYIKYININHLFIFLFNSVKDKINLTVSSIFKEKEKIRRRRQKHVALSSNIWTSERKNKTSEASPLEMGEILLVGRTVKPIVRGEIPLHYWQINGVSWVSDQNLRSNGASYGWSVDVWSDYLSLSSHYLIGEDSSTMTAK
jgi:hypothetical protein